MVRNPPQSQATLPVLLRLNPDTQADEIAVVGGSGGQACGPNGRTLYPYFCSLAAEATVTAFLARNYRPLNAQVAMRLKAVLVKGYVARAS